jgi:ribosomal protein S18 acetylase RimI-like enzyme
MTRYGPLLETHCILRPLIAGDELFSYQVYASTRAEEMAFLDWPAAQKEAFLQMQFRAQSQHYRLVYPLATYQVIEWDGVPVGRLILNRADQSTTLVDIALLPEFRNRGLGAALISALQSENRKINLHVLKSNPALNLYLRMGFIFKSEDALYFEMEWMLEVKA